MGEPQEYLLQIFIWEYNKKSIDGNRKFNCPPREVAEAPTVEEAEDEELRYWCGYNECACGK